MKTANPKTDPVAEAIQRNFTSVNVNDSNCEPANVVDVIEYVSDAIRKAGHEVAQSINNLADAIRGVEGPAE